MIQRASVPRMLAILCLFSLIAAVPASGQNEARVAVHVEMTVNIPSHMICETYFVHGYWDMIYSDPYPDPLDPNIMITDIVIAEMNLRGPDGETPVLKGGSASTGSTRTINPGIDFPAESFFDVFFELEIPGYPDTVLNYDPIHVDKLIEQFPPFFASYEYPEGMPPIPLFDKTTGLIAGELLMWNHEMRPYSEPELHLHVPVAYRSEVAVIAKSGLLEMTAAFSGRRYGYESEVHFGFREAGDPGPFLEFWVDPDGSGPSYSTINPMGEGDGYTAYFEPGSDPFDGGVYEFEASAFDPYFGWFRDTVLVYVDPTPPIPAFNDIDRDSTAVYHIDSFFDITYRLDDEMLGPGTAELLVFPLQLDFQRTLTSVDQLGLGTDHDSMACAPSAAASCLKYFAENGHPELDNPNGDESKPDQSAEDMAGELDDDMGTDENGTQPDEMVSGIEKYLKKHGKSGWSVEHGTVADDTDLGEMLREFESDSEDVLVLLQDTTASGDTIGHVVTLGSTHSTFDGSADAPDRSIDFMDPWGGGSTEDNEYDLGENDEGQSTTEGYDLDGAGGDAWVAGYIKVSPPEGAGASASSGREMLKAASRAPWMPVAAGIASGNGIVDTLGWDTHGFPGGLYLMEVVTTDDQGWQCRDLRMVAMFSTTTGDDEPGPGIKTMLRGSYPNPFNPATNIEFALAHDTKVTMVIYDVMGRRVRILMNDESMEAGVHTVAWDGKNDSGKGLASGVYFCRFIAEGQIEARKLIMLR